MSQILQELNRLDGVAGAARNGDGTYRLDLLVGGSRQATQAEVLDAVKAVRISGVNAECRARLIARYGTAEEQVSRSIGVYGADEQVALATGVAATIDASNTASNSVLAAADIAAVEAVSVSWPAI